MKMDILMSQIVEVDYCLYENQEMLIGYAKIT